MDTAALQGPDIFAGGHPCKIFVGNLPFSMTQDGLASLFKRHGAVIGAKMVEDRGTGKKKRLWFRHLRLRGFCRSGHRPVAQRRLRGPPADREEGNGSGREAYGWCRGRC
mmetsp:Transcript_25621/g.82716  ORF Transcript_25621/g.82716 Transcript_25621/m.82716 type:complete len:110 (+) Transcript_25621:57-386(+)